MELAAGLTEARRLTVDATHVYWMDYNEGVGNVYALAQSCAGATASNRLTSTTNILISNHDAADATMLYFRRRDPARGADRQRRGRPRRQRRRRPG